MLSRGLLGVGVWLGLALSLASCSKKNDVAVNNHDPCKASDAGAGAIVCDDGCVDPLVSTAHCGGCGIACATGAECRQGHCACPDVEVECSGVCVDTTSDGSNCGGCGTTCSGGKVCAEGTCACAQGQEFCSTSCVDTSSDEQNCGSCGHPCSAAETCEGGSCTCPGGGSLTLCDDACVDLGTSKQHCGRCGNACDITCVNGECDYLVAVAAAETATCAVGNRALYCWGNLPLDGLTPPFKPSVIGQQALQTLSGGGMSFCGGSGSQAWCWGANAKGQLFQATDPVTTPTLVAGYGPSDPSSIVAVSAANAHSCLLTEDAAHDRHLLCVGDNTFGQLGQPLTTASLTTPAEVALSVPLRVASGNSQTCAVGTDLTGVNGGTASVFCWGNGDPTPALRLDPSSLGRYVVDLRAAADMACAVLDDGRVFCWQPGGAASEVAGWPGQANHVAVGEAFACISTEAGEAWCWGPYSPLGVSAVQQVPGLPAVAGVTAGSTHACAWTSDGLHVWCWGGNGDGQLSGTSGGNTTVPVPVVF